MEETKRKISWQNLAPTVIAGILVSLLIGLFAFYRTVDKSLYTISDLQRRQIEQAAADYQEKKEMREAIFKLTIAVEKLIDKNENQDVLLNDLKTWIQSTKEYKKSID